MCRRRLPDFAALIAAFAVGESWGGASPLSNEPGPGKAIVEKLLIAVEDRPDDGNKRRNKQRCQN